MIDDNENWKVNIVKENCVFPFVIIDNWYSPDEEKAIWKELDFYSTIPKEYIDRAENTITARYKDGSSKSKAFRWYLSKYYTDEGTKVSPILNTKYKTKTNKFLKIMEEIVPYGRMFLSANNVSTMISYYEENDFYDSHHDTSMWTQCTWFVKNPKLFKGGDLDFPESEHIIKLKHNRSVFFPCCYLHRVSPIKFYNQLTEMGYGRYTITHFYNKITKI